MSMTILFGHMNIININMLKLKFQRLLILGLLLSISNCFYAQTVTNGVAIYSTDNTIDRKFPVQDVLTFGLERKPEFLNNV